jgi:hypothetical protein
LSHAGSDDERAILTVVRLVLNAIRYSYQGVEANQFDLWTSGACIAGDHDGW